MTAMDRPRIRVIGTERVIEGDLTTSLLNTLLREAVGIDTVCGGKAQCGRCLIRIVSGAEFLSPMRELEVRKLGALGAAQDMRLACQTHTRGDIGIEVVHWRYGKPDTT
jgi:ferredoxin